MLTYEEVVTKGSILVLHFSLAVVCMLALNTSYEKAINENNPFKF